MALCPHDCLWCLPACLYLSLPNSPFLPDTTYMFIMAGLSLYQLVVRRCPDTLPTVPQVFLLLALIIVLVVLRVVCEGGLEEGEMTYLPPSLPLSCSLPGVLCHCLVLPTLLHRVPHPLIGCVCGNLLPLAAASARRHAQLVHQHPVFSMEAETQSMLSPIIK